MHQLRVLGLCVVIGLLWAASARAAITGSSITTPANGAELFYNGDSGSGSVTIRGIVSGATVGAKGDLLCYSVSDSSATKIASGIDVSSGTFAVSASLQPIAGLACRLAMVPAGKTPKSPASAAFAGPAVSVSDQFSHSSSGNLFGYYVLTGTLPWSYAFQSVGECAINSSFATDTSTLGTYSVLTGNACLKQSAGTRSGLQIDGQNAYPPAAISSLTSRAGFEPLSYTAGFNAAHDVVFISETDTPTICDPPGGFPPTTSTCPSLHDSGIQIQQVTALLPGGQVARVTQRFVSVDGRAHSIDALFSQSVSAQAAGQSPGFQFPGQSSFANQGAPYSFSSFPSGPGSIAVISDAGGFLPATSNPIGAITYSRPPISASFVSASGAQTGTFLMHYADTVPAGGDVVYNWSFEQAASSGALQTLEGVERDRFANPIVIIGSPHSGAVTTDSSVRVRGQALDSVGISALTVGGHGVAVGSGGVFGTTVRLRVGKNVIVATATNIAGNTSQTSLVLTYKLPPCKVPRLRGKALATARRMLRKNHCAVGKIRRLHSRHVRKGRVISSKPRAGSKRRLGTKVGLVISRGR
jgi:Glucodextranase, domain B/PASTA domain